MPVIQKSPWMHFNKIYIQRNNDSDSLVHRLASFTVQLSNLNPSITRIHQWQKHQGLITNTINTGSEVPTMVFMEIQVFWDVTPIHSFIHSIGMCRMWQFLAVLRSFFHSSLLRTFSCHPSPPTSLPSSLTSSCHLFLGLPLNFVVPKFTHNTLLGTVFSSILCTCSNLT